MRPQNMSPPTLRKVLNGAPGEGAAGGKIPGRTQGGKGELNRPAGSQGGKKMGLKGRGLPGAKPGDKTITLQIVTPPAQNDDDKKFYEGMAKHFTFNPRTQ